MKRITRSYNLGASMSVTVAERGTKLMIKIEALRRHKLNWMYKVEENGRTDEQSFSQVCAPSAGGWHRWRRWHIVSLTVKVGEP
jgi:hypothetical protein